MRRYWVLALLALAECSPMVGFEISFALPNGAAISGDRLHLRGRKRCTVGSNYESEPIPAPPEPGLAEVEKRDEIRFAPGDTPDHTGAQFRGTRCEIAITAWYDTNHNQEVDPGDFVGRLPRTEIRSSGSLCRSPINGLGQLPLLPL